MIQRIKRWWNRLTGKHEIFDATDVNVYRMENYRMEDKPR